MTTTFKFILGLLTATFVALAASATDVTINTKNYDGGSQANGSTTLYFKGDKLMIENKGGKDNINLIFDANTRSFLFIDHNRKEYYEADQAKLKSLISQVRQSLAMAKAYMAQLPPEQQKLMEKNLGKFLSLGDDTGSTTFSAKGSATVKNWKTTRYEGTRNNQKILDLFMSSYSDLGLVKSDFRSMEVMKQVFSETIQEFAAVLPLGTSFQTMAGNLDGNPAFENGIPVKSVTYNAGQSNGRNEVESISKSSISSAIFSVPSGYVKKELQMPGMGN